MFEAIYGYTDIDHAIKCVIYKIQIVDNVVCWWGKCNGGVIRAPERMWKRV